MKTEVQVVEPLPDIWAEMDGLKGDLVSRCEKYARWTLPHLFPLDTNDETASESETGNVSIGPRLVNHLAHRTTETMFPNDTPFFSVKIPTEVYDEMKAELSPEVLSEVDQALRAGENKAISNMNLTAYRPQAVQVMALKVITGNALIHRESDGARTVYSVRDYCIRRDLKGNPLEIILRDSLSIANMSDEEKAAYTEKYPVSDLRDRSTEPATLYTHYLWDGSRWACSQSIEDVAIGEVKYFTPRDFPCIALAWDLARGDHYGAGLVEQYKVTFHNLDVLNEAMIDMVGVAADIKFLVNDAASFDVDEWNRAERGDYVAGKEGDITVPGFQFAVEIQVIHEIIMKWERELSQAFLMSSAGVRDAERVTAEEIRFFAREVESAFGGLYSRLALDWQKKEAEYEIDKINLSLPASLPDFEVQVTAGMENLTREGILDSLKLALSDMGMLEAIPEEIRAAFNPIEFAKWTLRQRGLTDIPFLFSEEQLRENQQRQLQEQQALMVQQGAVDVAKQSAK